MPELASALKITNGAPPVELRERAPELPYIPVLQGWTCADYERYVALYQAHGIDLAREPRVGVGSICRRQATGEVKEIIWALADKGLSLHGFGVKTRGLLATSRYPDAGTNTAPTATSTPCAGAIDYLPKFTRN